MGKAAKSLTEFIDDIPDNKPMAGRMVLRLSGEMQTLELITKGIQADNVGPGAKHQRLTGPGMSKDRSWEVNLQETLTLKTLDSGSLSPPSQS
jgi:hypothetical protein